MRKRLTQIYAGLFNERLYLKLAKEFFLAHDPATTPQGLIALEPKLAGWRLEFRADLLSSMLWTLAACIGAAFLGISAGKIGTDLPLAWPKLLAFAGGALAAWPTWFALANIEDTWDMDGRLDLSLRTSMFKLLFFPGLVITLIGMIL